MTGGKTSSLHTASNGIRSKESHDVSQDSDSDATSTSTTSSSSTSSTSVSSSSTSTSSSSSSSSSSTIMTMKTTSSPTTPVLRILKELATFSSQQQHDQEQESEKEKENLSTSVYASTSLPTKKPYKDNNDNHHSSRRHSKPHKSRRNRRSSRRSNRSYSCSKGSESSLQSHDAVHITTTTTISDTTSLLSATDWCIQKVTEEDTDPSDCRTRRIDDGRGKKDKDEDVCDDDDDDDECDVKDVELTQLDLSSSRSHSAHRHRRKHSNSSDSSDDEGSTGHDDQDPRERAFLNLLADTEEERDEVSSRESNSTRSKSVENIQYLSSFDDGSSSFQSGDVTVHSLTDLDLPSLPAQVLQYPPWLSISYSSSFHETPVQVRNDPFISHCASVVTTGGVNSKWLPWFEYVDTSFFENIWNALKPIHIFHCGLCMDSHCNQYYGSSSNSSSGNSNSRIGSNRKSRHGAAAESLSISSSPLSTARYPVKVKRQTKEPVLSSSSSSSSYTTNTTTTTTTTTTSTTSTNYAASNLGRNAESRVDLTCIDYLDATFLTDLWNALSSIGDYHLCDLCADLDNVQHHSNAQESCGNEKDTVEVVAVREEAVTMDSMPLSMDTGTESVDTGTESVDTGTESVDTGTVAGALVTQPTTTADCFVSESDERNVQQQLCTLDDPNDDEMLNIGMFYSKVVDHAEIISWQLSKDKREVSTCARKKAERIIQECENKFPLMCKRIITKIEIERNSSSQNEDHPECEIQHELLELDSQEHATWESLPSSVQFRVQENVAAEENTWSYVAKDSDILADLFPEDADPTTLAIDDVKQSNICEKSIFTQNIPRLTPSRNDTRKRQTELKTQSIHFQTINLHCQ